MKTGRSPHAAHGGNISLSTPPDKKKAKITAEDDLTAHSSLLSI
jgi:hypothetical protein